MLRPEGDDDDEDDGHHDTYYIYVWMYRGAVEKYERE